jgi:pyruvate dehydrogenase (quinone)
MAEALARAGAKRIHGVVGDSLNGFTDALRRLKSVDWIHMRHEEGAAFAAGAKARLTESSPSAPAAAVLVICA